MRVKAISLWEPWASLMATGAKTIETRSWSTPYRGPLLICAAKRCNQGELRELLARPDFQFGLATLLPKGGYRERVEIIDLNFGRAVALVDLVACERTERITPHYEEAEFGDYSPGRFGWVTTNLRRLQPFPLRGAQGLFDVEINDALLNGAPIEASERQGE